ncbi:MAG: SusC/RagA family TonB-linked outer membrane protein, partial [Bacteroidota bacterium]
MLNVSLILLISIFEVVANDGLAPSVGNSGLFAQQQTTITGKVTDADGQPLPGVAVAVKGTTQGVVTNIDGNYSISNVDEDATLVFSFVGMKKQEVAVGNQSTINVTMESETFGVDEVVVIGYTSTSRKNLASSISQIGSEQIVGLSTSDARQTLQGKMSGVQVINNNGDPGAGARILIRGMGSFSNPDPLYVIDGIQGGDINSIPIQDIESITVLKDASTTAIYGSAAANGVVVVTTKSGRRGDLQVNYDGSVGVAEITKRYDMLNAADYVDLVADIQRAGGLELTNKLKTDDVRTTRTDWQEEIFRTALVTDHNIRLSGGGENATYSFSSGYQNHESTVIDRNFQRLTLAAKLNERLFNNNLRLMQHLRIRNDVNNGIMANFNDALRMPPYLPVYDEDNLGGYSRADKVTDLNDANNPLNEVYNSDYQSRSLGVNVELSGELDLFEGLMLKSQARLSGGNYHMYDWDYPSSGGNFARTTSSINETYNWHYSMLLENFFTYNQTFG